MSPTAAKLEAVLNELRALRREVAELRGRPLSHRAVARALGVRWGRVGAAVKAGRIRTLPDGRIPADELERLQREGLAEAEAPTPRRARPPPAPATPIRSLKID